MEWPESLKYMRIQYNLLFSNPDKENLWSFTSLAAKYGSVREANHTEKLVRHQRAKIDTGLFSTLTMQQVFKSKSQFEGRTTNYSTELHQILYVALWHPIPLLKALRPEHDSSVSYRWGADFQRNCYRC